MQIMDFSYFHIVLAARPGHKLSNTHLFDASFVLSGTKISHGKNMFRPMKYSSCWDHHTLRKYLQLIYIYIYGQHNVNLQTQQWDRLSGYLFS